MRDLLGGISGAFTATAFLVTVLVVSERLTDKYYEPCEPAAAFCMSHAVGEFRLPTNE